MSQKISGDIVFGVTNVPATQVFLIRKNVFAIINHKPIARGHVLVCARREVSKLQELTEIESIDLFMTAQEVARKLQQIHKTPYQIFLQNGKEAGQSVPHVHLHLVPQAKNIEFLERKEEEVRNEEDMAREAEQYRSCFEQSNQ